MPGMYAPGHYDLAGLRRRRRRARRHPAQDRRHESRRRARRSPVLGPASQRLFFIRKIVERTGLPGLRSLPARRRSRTLGEALLASTKIYVKLLLQLVRNSASRASPTSPAGASPRTPRACAPTISPKIDYSAEAPACVRLAAGADRRSPTMKCTAPSTVASASSPPCDLAVAVPLMERLVNEGGALHHRRAARTPEA